jgi:hypothetical protein
LVLFVGNVMNYGCHEIFGGFDRISKGGGRRDLGEAGADLVHGAGQDRGSGDSAVGHSDGIQQAKAR